MENQRWVIPPVGGGFYRIANAGGADALGASYAAAGGDAEVGLAAYTGADGQMWHLDEFPDGGWRIRNKATGLSLREGGGGAVRLEPFVRDDRSLWTLTTP